MVSAPVNRNRIDYASGMRHLMVLLAVGIDEALRVDPDPMLAVGRTSIDDILTWGMECPDCIYLRATMRGGETYRLFGNRGTARYVGLQTMDGIASTTNCLVDELEVDADGNFEAILSADEHEGNWLRIAGRPSDADGAALLLRLGHRGAVIVADRADRRGGRSRRTAPSIWMSRCRGSCTRLGDFVHDNLQVLPGLQLRRRRSTGSCRRSTAPRSGRPRKTGPSSADSSWRPTRR